jgi:hypothetical protein
VANEKDGCRGLRFRWGGSLGVNFHRAKQYQNEKDTGEAEFDSDRCHGARIAMVLFQVQ